MLQLHFERSATFPLVEPQVYWKLRRPLLLVPTALSAKLVGSGHTALPALVLLWLTEVAGQRH